ncbi:LacI family DNA-binding transcriptional regulator [Tessaracoccus aquimaris]|uniref:LacI family DNA-binding transcriptional regulator n=1 Tax=Tessaracoccus aquimaris TaxID=1332264 RepID=UPI001D055BA4|nr:LacI family DNA-binding transcriptional regulator [Tessaracoccus aquimaris]
MSQPPRNATLHDVARLAQVSLATASRVLNGSTRAVADSYREKVQAAAAELGYTANRSAQATAKGTSATVALLVADIADPYFGEIAAGVASAAEELGLMVNIAMTDRDPCREIRAVRELRGQRPRGLILAASRTTDGDPSELKAELALLEAAGGRAVAIGGGAPDLRSVRVDNHGGAEALGDAMAALGYRRSIVLAADGGIVTSDDRVAGFRTGFERAGGSVSRIYRDGLTREAGHRAMAAALADGVEKGTVVFGVTDVVALGALVALREAGRSVGADIAIAGFDDVPASRDVTPNLTSVHVPLQAVGSEALRAAVDPDWSPDAAPLSVSVRVRESTPGLQ